MSNVIIGSARSDENYKYNNGKPGDQRQSNSGDDYSGEVSMQTFYVHKKGWVVLRPKNVAVADKIADAMYIACNNANIGYSQSDRYGIIKPGVKSLSRVNCDCSSLVRACIMYATGKDVGDFTTSDEASTLMATGMFDKYTYTDGMILYPGDILVTKTKGHTVIVVFSSASRNTKPVIYKGYKDSQQGGSFCKELQEDLNKLKVTDNNGKALAEDGSCGGKTEEAIKKFQKNVGLDVDGRCGPMTWAAIDKALSELDSRYKKGIMLQSINIIEGTIVYYDKDYDGYMHLKDYNICIPCDMFRGVS